MSKILFKYEGDYEFKPFSKPYESLIIEDNGNLEYIKHNEVINKNISKVDLDEINNIIVSNEELFKIKYYNVMGEDVTVRLSFKENVIEIRDFNEYKNNPKMNKLLNVLNLINDILRKYGIDINWGVLPE